MCLLVQMQHNIWHHIRHTMYPINTKIKLKLNSRVGHEFFFRATAFGRNFHQMLPGITAYDAVKISKAIVALSDNIYDMLMKLI